MSKTLALPENKSLFAITVQQRDLPEFFRLHDKNQKRIKWLLQAFTLIAQAPTLGLGYDRAAIYLAGEDEVRVKIDVRAASPGRLRGLYSKFRDSRDWRVLIDKALEWSPITKMPQEFLDHVQSKVRGNRRSATTAIKKLRAAWVAGESIPGYGTWREYWALQHPGRSQPKNCQGYPNGWTIENLRKKLDKSAFRQKANVEGRMAAAKLRPLVLSTRAGNYVASHYMWDDVWHDNFVNSLAERKAGRPLELFCHDYYSARKVRYGIKVRTEGDDGKMSGLTARMMRMVVAATYFLDGYSPRGTINVAEHGTAAFDEHMERTLHDHSGGLITVTRSGMQGDPAHLGQYNGRRTGNWRFKASLESSNNVVHNLLADLPGQTGPNRERRPEELHGLLQYNSRVLAAAQQLSLAKQALLQYPLLEVNQFQSVLSDMYKFLENDTEHELEGWAACGHYSQEIHIMGEWRTMEELMMLPERQREIAAAMIAGGHCETRPRKMSRREVYDQGSADLIRMHGGTVCELLGNDFAAEREVRGHVFAFHDVEVGPDEHQFEGIVTDDEGRQFQLKEKDKYLAFINPFAPNHLLVKDARGKWLGTANRIQRVRRGDVEGLERAMGRAKHVEHELLMPLAKQTHKENLKRLAMHRNNAAVISGEADEHEAIADDAVEALTLAVRSSGKQAFADAVHGNGNSDGTPEDFDPAHATHNTSSTNENDDSEKW